MNECDIMAKNATKMHIYRHEFEYSHTLIEDMPSKLCSPTLLQHIFRHVYIEMFPCDSQAHYAVELDFVSLYVYIYRCIVCVFFLFVCCHCAAIHIAFDSIARLETFYIYRYFETTLSLNYSIDGCMY